MLTLLTGDVAMDANAATPQYRALWVDARSGERIGSSLGRTAVDSSSRGQYRALWVDAFHSGFKSPEQTAALVKHARQYGFNTLIIEVRKTGDAYYRSKLEPVATDITPRYDPLEHVIALCHDTRGGQPRIEVHAWIVVYRVAKEGSLLPREHILKQHPEWMTREHNGNTREDSNIYVDPGAPGVIEHTAAVVAEIARGYDIDGLHLDYVRYPNSTWGYNQIALDRFNRLYGRRGKPDINDEQWQAFRRDQVTAMVRRIHLSVRTERPSASLSIAGIPHGAPNDDFTKTAPYCRVAQDWVSWLDEGLIDCMFLMNYKRELSKEQARDFRDWNKFAAAHRGQRHVAIGLGSYLQAGSLSLTQARVAIATPGVSGVCLFSYAVPTRSPSEYAAFWLSIKATVFKTAAVPPATPWLDAPTAGLVAGRVYDEKGRVADGALVAVNGPAKRFVRTDGGGAYVIVNTPPGRYNIRATLASGKHLDRQAIVVPGRVTACNMK